MKCMKELQRWLRYNYDHVEILVCRTTRFYFVDFPSGRYLRQSIHFWYYNMHRFQATFVYKIEAFGVADDDAYWSCLDWWSHECPSQVWSFRSTFCKSECAGELYFHMQSNISHNIHWCVLELVVYTQYTLCSTCEGERRGLQLAVYWLHWIAMDLWHIANNVNAYKLVTHVPQWCILQ